MFRPPREKKIAFPVNQSACILCSAVGIPHRVRSDSAGCRDSKNASFQTNGKPRERDSGSPRAQHAREAHKPEDRERAQVAARRHEFLHVEPGTQARNGTQWTFGVRRVSLHMEGSHVGLRVEIRNRTAKKRTEGLPQKSGSKCLDISADPKKALHSARHGHAALHTTWLQRAVCVVQFSS